MKIATWNLERPKKSSKRNQSIIECLKRLNADILILTETNEIIDLGESYNCFHSSGLNKLIYKEGEKRVSIYSKYSSNRVIETFCNDTSICIELNTPLGNLAVYGTVIGIYGNRNKNFNVDLDKQLSDFERITKTKNFCIGGDLNISFSDNYYFTKKGREKLNTCLEQLSLINLTTKIPQNIDHIVMTKSFVGDRTTKIETWNADKKLSDHIGVSVEII